MTEEDELPSSKLLKSRNEEPEITTIEEEHEKLPLTDITVKSIEKALVSKNLLSSNMTSSIKVALTAEDLLDQIGIWHPYPLFITFSMSFLWFLSVMSTMSPSYMAPSTVCLTNCTFLTIQQEFKITKAIIDPGEMTSSVYFLGNGVLGQVFAITADRVGRRPVLITSLFIAGLAGTFSAFAPSFELMLVGRFFQGSCFTALTMINWLMCSESISFSGHGYASVLFGIFWVIGYCVISPFAMMFSSWRHVQLATSIPCLIFGILMLFTLPESFQFLVIRRKRDELVKWIETASKVGNDELDYDADQIVDMSSTQDDMDRSLWQTLKFVLKSQALITYTIVETFLWIVDFMIYSALSLSSTGVGSTNMHISYIFSGLVEIPAYFLLPAAIDWLGRKPSVMLCHLVAAFSLLSMYLFDKEADPEIFLIIWLIAKFAIACAFMLCFVYGAELFPTHCRSICLGTCATISNFGAMIAPHVPAMDILFPGLHHLFYALALFIATVLTTILPETKENGSGIRSQQQSIA